MSASTTTDKSAGALDELRARAALHGLHVTGASLNAARRLLRPPPRLAPNPLPPPTTSTPTPPATDWPSARRALAAEFPKAREGILYAAHRLRQDPTLTLPDIRDEAAAAGVKIGGHSLYSARALLNGSQGRAAVAVQQGSLADHLRRLVADFEREAGREAARMRAAIGDVVRVLRAAMRALPQPHRSHAE